MKRLALLAVVALAACEGPAGPDGRPGIVGPMGEPGEQGPGASPGITAVFPRSVPVGLKSQIAISGTGTMWNDSATVTFSGSDINVLRVRAASPTALIVDLEVLSTATTNTRDLSVVQAGGAPLHYRGVFSVTPLITMVPSGRPARGSLVSVTVTHHDPAFEFDTSWSGSTFTGINALLSPPGVVVIRDVKPHSVTLLVSLDTDAPLGQRDLRLVSSWKRPSEVTLSFPNIFDVGELTEKTIGLADTGTLESGFDSVLYKFTPLLTSVELLASVTTTNGLGNPMLVLVPTNGRFTSSSLAFMNSYTFTPYALTDYRFVVVDPSNTPGVEYAITVLTPMKVLEVEPNEPGMAQPVTVPSIVTPATLSSGTDVDVYKVTVGPGEVGRSLRIRTRAGDYSTDLRVELTLADGTAVMTPADLAYHEDVRSPRLTVAGEYFVKLSWGRYTTAVWQTYTSRYDLLLNWE